MNQLSPRGGLCHPSQFLRLKATKKLSSYGEFYSSAESGALPDVTGFSSFYLITSKPHCNKPSITGAKLRKTEAHQLPPVLTRDNRGFKHKIESPDVTHACSLSVLEAEAGESQV